MIGGADPRSTDGERQIMTREGQTVAVIGGSSGIGAAVAEMLDAEGAQVVIGSHNPTRLEASLAQLSERASCGQIDVTDERSVARFFAQAPQMDHLIYTAGATLNLMTVPDIDLDAARAYYEIRCFGILRAVKHAAPRIRPDGSIVLTSGIAGARPSPGWTVAAGTAATIEAFTRSLAVELAPLRVNAISPGTVATPLWDAMTAEDRDAYYTHIAATNLTQTIADPAEIALAYAFLIDQPFATGSTLTLDGGRLLV
jgi:NAD(P)-dependent dehydrogenase (short-subunit alcohol dehydrogenase family)